MTATPTPPAEADSSTGASTDAGPGQTPDETAATDDADGQLDWRAFVPTDTADHLATMDRAARDSGCGVPWHLLAAIARVESNFGRNMATSSAGAVGYGQFLPSSWRAFGNDGNVYDYRDALPAIATYLCESGLARDPRAALFAYNHADWYVDLVLDLAVRYDRMAPGAPTPDVLDVGPALDVNNPLRYASGRDLKVQSSRRSLPDGSAAWLGVPWRGRPAGAPVSRPTLDTTALSMLRATFGLTGDPAPADARGATPVGFASLASRAWESGLLPYPSSSAANPPGVSGAWSLEDLRAALAAGRPVTVLVAAAQLPGHADLDTSGDQPIVITGTTAQGFIYNDPSFSSSLGYGLVMDEAALAAAWSAASTPFDAVAVARRPRMLEPRLHALEPVFPPLAARVFPTAAPVQLADSPEPVAHEPDPTIASDAIVVASEAFTLSEDDAAARQVAPAAEAPAQARERDGMWATAVALMAAALLGGAVGLTVRRSRLRATS